MMWQSNAAASAHQVPAMSGTGKFNPIFFEGGSDQASRLSRTEKFGAILNGLRADRLSPIDLMLYVLDPQLPEFDRYRVGLYRESGKLAELMDVIMADPRGEERLHEWMRPHAVNATCTLLTKRWNW